MSGVETYGGCCPICLKSMFQKWESTVGGFTFDACSWCGFLHYDDWDGYSEIEELTESDKMNAWKDIFDRFGVLNRAELCLQVAKDEYAKDDDMEFFPSIFKHADLEDAHPLYKILWHIHSGEDQGKFSLEGLRVYRKDDAKTNGILLEYKKGKVTIDWETTHGNRCVEEIEALEIGKTIMLSSEPSLKNMLNQAEAPYLKIHVVNNK